MRYLLLIIFNDVEPHLRGPYKSDRHRLQAARRWRRRLGDGSGFFRVNQGEWGSLTVEPFGGAAMEID